MFAWCCLVAARAAEPDPFVKLSAPAAEASSFLRSNWNKFTENYHPNYALDGDPATAWVEGVDGPGVGEWLGWRTSKLTGVHRVKLRVRNGYHKSASLLTANAAARVLTVSLRRGDSVQFEQRLTLERALGWQEFVLDPPEDLSVDNVRLRVDEAVPGKVYADLCLSDVELWVDAETAWSSVFERSKQLALESWIAERRSAAAYFASQPEEYPFAATHFGAREVVDPAGAEVLDPLLLEVAAARQALAASPGPWRRVDGTPPRLPDGLELPEVLARWFSPDLTFFEATDEWRSRRVDPDNGIVEDSLTNARLAMAPDGTTPRHATFRRSRIEVGRSSGRDTDDWFVRFDEVGRPRTFVATWTDVGDGCDQSDHAEVFEVVRDAAGRVSSVRRQDRGVCVNAWDDGACSPGRDPEGRDARCPDEVGFREVVYAAAP